MPSPLAALSPLDGRYARTADPLRGYFSEQALIRYRVRIELAWLEADAEKIKQIEAETNHDVKAIEYWLKGKLGENAEAQRSLEFIHFACTSEDINNLAYALMVRESRDAVMLPRLDEIAEALTRLAHRHAGLAMLSRTHGQAATPTTLGKEMANFAYRLSRARGRIAEVAVMAKANGAVGNYNAHLVAYPDFDWERFSRRLVERLGLEFNPYTTQIEPHDWLARLLDHAAQGEPDRLRELRGQHRRGERPAAPPRRQAAGVALAARSFGLDRAAQPRHGARAWPARLCLVPAGARQAGGRSRAPCRGPGGQL